MDEYGIYRLERNAGIPNLVFRKVKIAGSLASDTPKTTDNEKRVKAAPVLMRIPAISPKWVYRCWQGAWMVFVSSLAAYLQSILL